MVTLFVPAKSRYSVVLSCNGVKLLFLIVLLCGADRACAEDRDAGKIALQNACQYLWSQQAKDGGWHSSQYGLLRSGQALTPFILHTLLQVPEADCPRPAGGAERALDFFRKHVNEVGALGHADPDIAEYPVYSTAYAVQCFVAAGKESDRALSEKMTQYLVRAQFCRKNGFDPSMPAYGGWGFDAPKAPGEPGHMDLAHTRRALLAIKAHFAKWRSRPVRRYPKEVEMFLRVVQRHPDAVAAQPQPDGDEEAAPAAYDGGFYFSPVVLAANKGGVESDVSGTKYFRSYATATCEGLLALRAAGVSNSDDRCKKAVEWLRAHDDLDYPQGVPKSGPVPWGDAIRFYHYSVRAEVYDELNWPGDWQDKLAAAVVKHQLADGSFRNTTSPLMKEDDPLVATPLAVVALSHCARL
jgi:hypothetical protein